MASSRVGAPAQTGVLALEHPPCGLAGMGQWAASKAPADVPSAWRAVMRVSVWQATSHQSRAPARQHGPVEP